MSRVIIKVLPRMDDPVPVVALDAPSDLKDYDSPLSFPCSPQEAVFRNVRQGLLEPDAVAKAGQRLYEQLATHPAIKRALEDSLKPGEVMRTIYIHVRATQAEELPWEALCTPPGPPYRFLALDATCPVARIATPVASEAGLEYFMETPLRVAAVLSAKDIPAASEWSSLRQALLAADRDVNLLALVGEEAFKTELDAIAAKDPRLQVEFIPELPDDLMTRLRRFAPHLLHFFCHGSTDGGPHLQVATPQDWAFGVPGSSIRLEIGDLEQVDPYRRYTWLVTLNCCLGGVSVDNAPSLARKLVERGFPAAVGMREVLSNQDAPVFSRQLYGGLLEELDERLATGNRRFELNWSKLLRQPRRLLHQARAGGPPPAGPERRKEWTLPILYVAPSPFRLRRPSSNDALRWNAKRHKQSELTTYLDKIAKLTRLETPDAALEEIRGLALTVEAELYPDA